MMDGLPSFPKGLAVKVYHKKENPTIPIIRWDNRAFSEGTNVLRLNTERVH
jgi:hypothetical protein